MDFKTYVIAVRGLSSNNNYSCLFPSLETPEYRVLFMNALSAAASYMGTELKTNYDILLNLGCGEEFGFKKDSLKGLTFNLPRFSKREQVAFLHSISGNYKGMKVPKMFDWDASTGLVKGLVKGLQERELLLKIPHGARGIGQVHFELNPEGTMHGLVSNFVNDFIKGNTRTNPHGKGTIITGIEHSEKESEEILRKEILEADLYEVIKDIKAEYRVLTDYHGDVVFCAKRHIQKRTDNFSQGEYISEIQSPEVLPKELLRMLKENIKQSSVDVFLREDSWGVFEFQPQTGLDGIPWDVVKEYHENFIKNIIKDVAF